MSRPPEMPSTVAACLASIAGSWNPVEATRPELDALGDGGDPASEVQTSRARG